MPEQVWTSKYSPKKLSEFSGNADAVTRVKRWALEWSRGTKGKPICLWGASGIGKTALALALASEMDWEPIVFSPYDAHDSDKWQKALASSFSACSLFGNMQLVILEDADIWVKSGMRGIISSVAEMLQNPAVPVIITAGDWYGKNLVPLRGSVEQLQMKAVNSPDVEKALSHIAHAEHLAIPPDTLKQIAQNAGGDLRAAINDLQASNTLASRERPKQIFEKVRTAMRSPNYRASKSSDIGALADRDMLKMYVLENIPSEFPDASDRARALSRLSRADIFDGRIMRRQYWGYLRYSSDLMIWGVSSERLHPGAAFASYGFPSYIQKMGASRARRALFKSAAQKISTKLHTTSLKARSFFPLLAAQNDLISLSAFYGFDEEEAAAVLGRAVSPSAKPKAARAPAKKAAK